MIKKTDKPEPKATPIEANPAATTESWSAHWGVSRRLLEMRRRLRGTKLWATFEIERSFEAFSIHALANGIEEVATDCGLISSFRVTRWSKEGNRTVVEGMVTFENVDDGEVREYPGVGEAVDNSDKGLHKADSDARKIALINALNLGLGSDKEAANEKQDAAAGPKMGGAPQQAGHAKTAEDYIQPAPGGVQGSTNGHGAAPAAQKMYTLQQRGVKARAVLGSGVLSNCWAIIQNSGTVADLDDFVVANEAMLTEFTADDPTTGGALHKIVQTRRGDLAAKGLM